MQSHKRKYQIRITILRALKMAQDLNMPMAAADVLEASSLEQNQSFYTVLNQMLRAGLISATGELRHYQYRITINGLDYMAKLDRINLRKLAKAESMLI